MAVLAAGLGACALLAACAPVQAGAAAVVGDQRITVSSLDTQVSNLQAAAKPYGSAVQIKPAQLPDAVLSWMIRFEVMDEMAAANGISVTDAQAQAALNSLKPVAQQNGLASTAELLVANGVPPQMFMQVGRWEAQQDAFALKHNGGKPVTSQTEQDAVTSAISKASCQAAKSLDIKVSPQYGRLDFTPPFAVVAAPDTLSRPAGTPSPANHQGPRPGVLTVLLSSPRVAPGLLSWQAWSALHAAGRVLAGSAGHPLIPALAAAGVVTDMVDGPSSADGAALAAFLSSAVSASPGPVVWLAPQGEAADPALLGSLSVPHEVLNGAPDLPGAHLLDLVSIMDRLRVACPWDREQTHQSLLPYLLEEAYEAAETIETGDLAALREEIGDVMFQAFFHARIAAERPVSEDGFTIDEVADTLAAKLVRRHPHVFGSVSVSSAADVNANWEEIKKAERAAKAASATAGSPDGAGGPSVLDGVSFGQPALSLAAQLQRRAERAGIVAADGGNVPGVGLAAAAGDQTSGERLGGALMALVARAGEAGLDPELELRAAARRFADSVRARERPAG